MDPNRRARGRLAPTLVVFGIVASALAWITPIAGGALVAGGLAVGLLVLARDLAWRPGTTEREAAALDQVTRLNRLYAVRSGVSGVIVRARTRDDLLRDVCRVAVEHGQPRMAWIGWIDRAAGRVVPVASAGAVGDYLDDLIVSIADEPAGRGPVGTAARTGRLVTMNDIATHADMAPWRTKALAHRFLASAGVPLFVHGEPVAVFAFYAGEPHFFDGTERTLVDGIGADLSFALEHLEHEALRQRAEGDLRASEERFRTLFTATPFPLAVVDPGTHRFLAANSALARLYGSDAAALDDMAFDALWPDLASGAVVLPLEPGTHVAQHGTRDGRTIDVELAATEILFEGRGACLVSIQDVTDRRRLEMEVRQSQRMEAVGRLAGGVAHDFNNLLTAIRGFAALTLEDMTAADPRRPAIEQIERAGERAADLTRHLLAFSRRQILQPRIVDLNAVITETTRMLHRLIGEDISLVTDLQPELGRVAVDPGQIDQVVMNLAINARDAMPDGGRLTIGTANVTVRRRMGQLPPGEYVRVSVADRGSGIPPEILAHIFEPFFTTKDVGRGTGLGLSTVHGIITQSGGHLEVATTVGHGTTFHIYLPRVAAPVTTRRAIAVPAAPEVTGTILVVEDERAVRQLTQTVLERRGYTVIAAASAEEAMKLAAGAEAIDLLLTDVVMPGTSGPQLAAQLAGVRPDLRVVYMSGYADNPLGTGTDLHPGVRLLTKPFTRQSLETIVHDALAS